MAPAEYWQSNPQSLRLCPEKGGYSDFRFQCTVKLFLYIYTTYMCKTINTYMDTDTLRRGHYGSRFMCSIACCFMREDE